MREKGPLNALFSGTLTLMQWWSETAIVISYFTQSLATLIVETVL
jgi:hypothetical protein